jgi:hypothetical protein
MKIGARDPLRTETSTAAGQLISIPPSTFMV